MKWLSIGRKKRHTKTHIRNVTFSTGIVHGTDANDGYYVNIYSLPAKRKNCSLPLHRITIII